MKTKSKRLHAFDKELIASIENERKNFEMSRWLTLGADQANAVASCKTASCMAGHIESLRRPLAKRLASKPEFKYGSGIDHTTIAREIYQRETGKICTLDFHAEKTLADIVELTRQDAIDHIKGKNPEWEQLTAEELTHMQLS